MRITNTSKIRQRIEGCGYVDPGETITVSEEAGLQLRKSPDFKEERAKRQREGTEGQRGKGTEGQREGKEEKIKNKSLMNKGLMNQTPTDKATKK